MKTKKDCKIEAVVSRDATRPVLGAPYFRGGALWATDGRAMVRLPVESDETDTEGWVPVEALKAARKVAGKLDSIAMHVNGAATLLNGQSFPRPNPDTMRGNWPACERIWDISNAHETKFTVAFNAELLANIAEAFGSAEVKLEMTDAETVIRVSPVGKAPNLDARAVLMPIRTA